VRYSVQERPGGSQSPAIRVEAGFCDVAGRCTCNVAMPAPCSADDRYQEMVAIRQRLADLDRILDGALVRSTVANVSVVTARVQALEESIRRCEQRGISSRRSLTHKHSLPRKFPIPLARSLSPISLTI